MLSTTTMARLGRVFSNWMINVQLTNQKLRERGQRILTRVTGASPTRAARTLTAAGGSLPVAVLMLHKGIKRDEAQQLLTKGKSIATALRSFLAEKELNS
jgi:N-acetylmuramic acid 6-phosphate etherase